MTGTGASAAAAQQVVRQVSTMAADVLAERRDELAAPDATRIRLQVVTPPTAALPLLGSPLRAAAAAGAPACPGEPRCGLRC
ncbi:hypothetical protein [Nocardioides sp. B-3]|uniref:hypothetical protein n=1 Tax=Nocardioides sp. B-3 TaxID=2895565 RepID=UPI002152B5C7|nr:hypothetical protein [Nocardioides sp. B-3]UUZ60417.1 hypothetical protein LP418_05835 [Nocardioides sp. B-3]